MKNFSTLSLIFVTLAAVVMGGAAQISPSQPPAAAAEDCSSLVYGLVDCMGYLAVGGTEPAPRASCCLGFRTLVEANADCVCAAIVTATNFGIDVDMSRARLLPLVCGIEDPYFTTCNVDDLPDVSSGAPLLPPASTISAPPSATVGLPDAPAPAPSSSSFVVPAIYFNFVFVTISFFFFIYA